MADWRQLLVDDDDHLRRALTDARTIAVIGFKPAPHEAAYRIPAYLKEHGYRVIPVTPLVETGLDAPAVATVDRIDEAVDIVDVFRAPHNLPPHVDEILAMPTLPRLVWFQLGIRDDSSAERLARAGIEVVQDRCILVDHQRLVG